MFNRTILNLIKFIYLPLLFVVFFPLPVFGSGRGETINISSEMISVNHSRFTLSYSDISNTSSFGLSEEESDTDSTDDIKRLPDGSLIDECRDMRLNNSLDDFHDLFFRDSKDLLEEPVVDLSSDDTDSPDIIVREENSDQTESSQEEKRGENRENEGSDPSDIPEREPHKGDLALFSLARGLGIEHFQTEVGFVYTSYKDDRSSKIAAPFLLRTKLSDRWEFRLASDFLEFQSPHLGIDDMTVGFGYTIRKDNPSISGRLSLKMPTGTSVFTDDAWLPGLHFAIHWTINDHFDLSANLGYASKSGATGQSTYKDQKNKIKFGYRTDGGNYYYVQVGQEFPDNSNPDRVLISWGFGYRKVIGTGRVLIFDVNKYTTEGDKDWVIGIGIGQTY